MGSLKVRFSQSSERVGGLNYSLRVEVVSSEGMPTKIFVFHQMPAGIDGNTFAEFDHVATPVDFQEIPEDAASELVPWYRDDKCTVWFRSISDLRMAKQMFVDDIYELQRNFDVLTSEEDFRDQTTLEFSDEGVQKVADVQVEEPISLRSMAKIVAVSSMLLLGSYSSLGASVQSADLNTLDLDTNPSVVTNVSFEGLATSEDIQSAISTNNQDFVDAVKNTPITFPSDIDVGDLAGYGTVGALIIAMAAAIAWLKSKAAATDTALAGKADASDLPYRLVTIGEWVTSNPDYAVVEADEPEAGAWWSLITIEGESKVGNASGNADSTSLTFVFGPDDTVVTATRSFALLDRAGNRVVVAGDTTLMLPAAVPGYMRDLIVRLDLTALATAPEVTFAAPTGETVTFETGDGAMPELEAGKVNLVSLTETDTGVIDIAHKTMQEVA